MTDVTPTMLLFFPVSWRGRVGRSVCKQTGGLLHYAAPWGRRQSVGTPAWGSSRRTADGAFILWVEKESEGSPGFSLSEPLGLLGWPGRIGPTMLAATHPGSGAHSHTGPVRV